MMLEICDHMIDCMIEEPGIESRALCDTMATGVILRSDILVLLQDDLLDQASLEGLCTLESMISMGFLLFKVL